MYGRFDTSLQVTSEAKKAREKRKCESRTKSVLGNIRVIYQGQLQGISRYDLIKI